MPLLDHQLLERRTQDIGRELFQRAKRTHEHLTTLNRWTKQVLAWCLSDHQLKTRVLGLIDVLPSLRTGRDVVRHLQDYFPAQLRLPPALRLGVSLSRPGLLTASVVWIAVRQLVEQVGGSPESVGPINGEDRRVAQEWEAAWHLTGQAGVPLIVSPEDYLLVGCAPIADVQRFFSQ